MFLWNENDCKIPQQTLLQMFLSYNRFRLAILKVNKNQFSICWLCMYFLATARCIFEALHQTFKQIIT